MKTTPVIVVSNPKESTEFISPSELPGNHLKHAVWHQLPKNKVKGNELKCPRIRKGPHESSGSSSSSSSSSDSDVEAGKRIKLRHNYKNKKENWNKASIVNFSYQDLGHGYQVKNFIRVLKMLESCIQLHLVDNSLEDIHSVKLPSCHSLNLQKNHFTSFKSLPKCDGLLHLDLSVNNIGDLDGCERFKNLQTLDLSLNPIQYTLGYRSRVFAKFPNLKYLDGIPLLNDDHPENYPEKACLIL
ncbi:unnamed protein product [Clavelina lepadiformis]|uniref:Leucine-rich repeat-containing protein 51 n=1 Tax=Clavelina lepadiformis TaxID=159417 RepID=A0ABP0GBP9_CLALP